MVKYTDEKHAQIVLALLKAHGVRKIIVSPGSTNIPIVGSIQCDKWFEVFSSVDERSAAYIACGLAEQSGEPVALSCTGSTASRNYLPGLTEAYYRKLPVIAITSFTGSQCIGNLMPQVIDRSHPQNDVCKLSINLPVVKDNIDFAYCEQLVNNAILESKRHGGGPVHINLATTYIGTFNTAELPKVRVMHRFTQNDELPVLEARKIAVFIGAKAFSKAESDALEKFAKSSGAIVLCGHSSNYYGYNRFDGSLAGANLHLELPGRQEYIPDLVIHIGEISEAYEMYIFPTNSKELWRVSEDGELRDTFGKLTNVFEMPLDVFFSAYSQDTEDNQNEYYNALMAFDMSLRTNIPELPFSNAWLAKATHDKIPVNCKVFLGILNSVRAWGCFPLKSKEQSVNSGGFGIDGIISTAVGSSLADKDKLHIVVVGDLAFFYDMNVLGNRHIGSNLRILLVNNGRGCEFRLYSHKAQVLGEGADEFVAANNHYINHFDEKFDTSTAEAWSKSLGWTYMSAKNKDEYLRQIDSFLSEEKLNRPVLFEITTTPEDESDGVKGLFSIGLAGTEKFIFYAKAKVMKIIPKNVKKIIQKVLRK